MLLPKASSCGARRKGMAHAYPRLSASSRFAIIGEMRPEPTFQANNTLLIVVTVGVLLLLALCLLRSFRSRSAGELLALALLGAFGFSAVLYLEYESGFFGFAMASPSTIFSLLGSALMALVAIRRRRRMLANSKK
jgi:hypothetical protein